MSIGRQIGCKSRFLLETDNWYAIPTMGSLTVGYILLVTKQHYLSLANLDSNLFFEMLNLKKSVEDFLFKKLGMHCIAFEHGTTNSYSTGANSVDHVHLHILPFSRPVWNEIITNIPATTVNTVESYNDLFEVWKKNIPDTYLLFQDLDQKLYYISDSSYMPSQLFRKCLAPYLGANYWDWRSESYSNNILETISLFKGIVSPLAPPCEPSGVRQFPSLPLLSVWLPCQQRVAVAGGNDFIEWVLQENNLRGFQDYLKGQH